MTVKLRSYISVPFFQVEVRIDGPIWNKQFGPYVNRDVKCQG